MHNVHPVSDHSSLTNAITASNALSEPVKRPFIAPKLVFIRPKLTKQGSLVHLTTQASPDFEP